MTLTRLIPIGILAVAILFVAASPMPAEDSLSDGPADRPNILLIFSDDQGVDDVGCYGSEIATPNIDSIATKGIKFNQFYAASSICTPSRYGLLTGRFAQRSQDRLTGALMFLAEADAARGIRPGETTFVSQLQGAGYETHLVGKWHLGHGGMTFWPTRHGFDTFFGHTGGCVDFFTCRYGNQPDWYRGESIVPTHQYATDEITDEAVRRITEFGRRDGDQPPPPWYLHVAYNAPHFGKAWDEAEQQPQNVMQPKPADLKRVAEIRDPLRRAFAAKVVGMDDGIGQLLEALDRSGQSRRTLVIFMTDHGGDANYGGSNKPLRGGKATLFEGGIRVPCVAKFPGVIPPSTETDAIATALDWYPTIVELSGIEPPPKPLDGQSILPLLRGETGPKHRPIAWSTGSHAELGRKDWNAVRDGRWKWVAPPGEPELLFDLSTDPGETKDIASEHPEIVRRLRSFAESTR